LFGKISLKDTNSPHAQNCLPFKTTLLLILALKFSL